MAVNISATDRSQDGLKEKKRKNRLYKTDKNLFKSFFLKKKDKSKK